jgi:hypothetical protein
MVCRAGKIGWLGVLVGWLAAGAGTLPAQTQTADALPVAPPLTATATLTPAHVAIEEMPGTLRDKVRGVMEKATLTTRGPAEVFTCRPAVYYWLLDNPDQAVRLWRLLGAKCTDIQRETTGFCWHDDQGSRLHWDVVLHTGTQCVWFAEGKVNPGRLLPTVDVQAVVVLNHTEGVDAAGKPAIRHQIEMYLKTDGKAISMAAKIVGASSPRVAEQYLGQMEMFFAAMAWYLEQHPQKAEEMFTELRKPQTSPQAGKVN